MRKEVNIRLNANRAKVVNTGYKFSSGDKGIVFKITVDELDTTGTTAKIVFKRSNGTSVESNITAAENVYSYTTLGNELEVIGPVVADVKFYEGENRISTSTFIFEVVSDTMDGIGSGTAGYSDTLEQMKESMLQAQDGMNATKGEMETLSSQLETLYDSYAEAFGTTGAFNPKGNYSAEESYTVRDLVTYNGGMWICKKNCTGATPGPDSDCWQYFFSHAEIEAIITGKQQVGNAKTLDGHGAEYFFPKSGGTIDGNLEVVTSLEGTRTYRLANAKRDIRLTVYADGTFRMWDATNVKALMLSTVDGKTDIDGTASGNLPLTGGKIDSTGNEPLCLNSLSEEPSVLLGFSRHGVSLGYFGFNGNKPCVLVGRVFQDILHTGNKPTGTYTGNGDATERTIATGGVGAVAIVYSSFGYSFLTTSGAVIITSSGNVSFTTDAYFSDGNIVSKTNNEVINGSGTRRYQVL